MYWLTHSPIPIYLWCAKIQRSSICYGLFVSGLFVFGNFLLLVLFLADMGEVEISHGCFAMVLCVCLLGRGLFTGVLVFCFHCNLSLPLAPNPSYISLISPTLLLVFSPANQLLACFPVLSYVHHLIPLLVQLVFKSSSQFSLCQVISVTVSLDFSVNILILILSACRLLHLGPPALPSSPCDTRAIAYLL